MARLPYVDPETAPQAVGEVLAALPAQLNIFRMVANSTTALRGFLGLGTALLGSRTFDVRVRELVILHVGRITGGRYEWAQHVPIAKAVGCTDEQIAALEAGETAAACFSGVEAAALRFAEEAASDCRVGDETFAAAHEHLDAEQIVELIVIVGFYRMVAMLTEITDIEIDSSAGAAIIDAAKNRQARED